MKTVDFISTYTKQPTVGRSIGPSTTNVSGSLDFYGKISAEGRQPKYFGVTCHHVAFPPSRPAVAGGVKAPYDHGFKDALNMMTIDGQSSYDHNKFIESSRYSAAKKRNGIRDFIEQDRRSKEGATKPLTQYQHNNIITTKKLVQRIEAELQAVNDFPRLMGTVRCSSRLDRYTPGDGIMDWALFELDEDRFTKAEELNNVSFQTF